MERFKITWTLVSNRHEEKGRFKDDLSRSADEFVRPFSGAAANTAVLSLCTYVVTMGYVCRITI